MVEENNIFSNYRKPLEYAFASIATYAFLFLAITILVEWINLPVPLSFFLSYLATYLLSFYLQFKIFSGSEVQGRHIKRFIIHLVTFLLLSNILFNCFYSFVGLRYIYAAVCTIATLFIPRYICSKNFVFK